MKNPCKTCLVKVICIKACIELDNYIDTFVFSFEKNTPVGIVAEQWLKTEEIRPSILQLWREHGY
ncbi:MAG: hypothetical protein ACFFG0_00470 [Candidatus Thorarchaeota archaeon]